MKKLIFISIILVLPTVALADFVVKYDWHESVMVGCPSPQPVCDEFGRCAQSLTTTLAACYEIIRHPQKKVFKSLEEAEAFVSRGKNEIDLSNFVITEE